MSAKLCCIVLLFAGALLAAQGTVPLKNASAYPNNAVLEDAGIGAAVLTASEIKQRFVTDLGRDYLVLEVALYPKDGKDLVLEPEKFVLRTADQERAIRSENPKVIAGALQKADESRRDIEIIPHVGVGYETGGRRYDPSTGTYTRGGGIYTSTGVAVVVGSTGPSDPGRKNEEVMALELTEKGLPAGNFQKPVAGHLYFRVGKDALKDSAVKFELNYALDGKEAALPLKR